MRNCYTVFTTSVAALSVAVGLLVLVPGQAGAANVDFDTHITLEEPVRIPGGTLPAGDYVFQRDQNGEALWIFSESDGVVFGPYLIRGRNKVQASRERLVILERPANAGTLPRLPGAKSVTSGPSV